MQPELNRDGNGADELTYLLTFATYGTWLPGQDGSVSRGQNLFGSRLPEPVPHFEAGAKKRLVDAPFLLDAESRLKVLASIQEVCAHRGWFLQAAHIRSNHVHVVVSANQTPELVMTAFKAYASRALNGVDFGQRRWVRHGSTRYLWTRESIHAAVRYVVCEQGEPMAVFEAAP